MVFDYLCRKISFMDINWVEIQKSQICNNDDAILYNEIVACYKNKLYRSGYLLAWILLIESLKRKIIELASLDDSRGKTEWQLIEQMEQNHQSTDCQIALSAKECEIISDTEFTTINSLWQQRCIFAHPYMQEVKVSDLEYIISKLVDITLSKPLSLSKKMIEEKLDEIVNSPHIIPVNPEEQNNFIKQQLVLIKEKHYPVLYKNLFFYLSKAREANNNTIAAFMRRYILILLNNIDINSPIFTIEKQLSKFPHICWLIFNIPDSWSKLNDKYQGDLFRYLQSAPKSLSSDIIVNAYRLISKGVIVKNDCLKIYYNKLKYFSILQSHALYIDKSILLDRIWDEYIKDWQFTSQMKYIEFLENLNVPVSEFFNNEESKRLGVFLGNCCRNNTFSALTFANKCSSIWIDNLSFCSGVIEGVMSKDDNIYIHQNCFSCALHIFSNLSKENLDIIIGLLEALPNDMPSQDLFVYEQIVKYFNDNKHLISDQSAHNRLNDLITKFYEPAIKLKAQGF